MCARTATMRSRVAHKFARAPLPSCGTPYIPGRPQDTCQCAHRYGGARAMPCAGCVFGWLNVGYARLLMVREMIPIWFVDRKKNEAIPRFCVEVRHSKLKVACD